MEEESIVCSVNCSGGVREDLGEFKGLELCHSLVESGDRVSAPLILDALNRTKHHHLGLTFSG